MKEVNLYIPIHAIDEKLTAYFFMNGTEIYWKLEERVHTPILDTVGEVMDPVLWRVYSQLKKEMGR